MALVFAFAVAMATSSTPSSLYVLYEQRIGFGSLTTAAIFSAYPIGVVLGLSFLGHLSDRIGRKPALVLGLGILLLSDGVFLSWITVPGLLLARLITGLAIGVVTSTATAHLGELGHIGSRERADRIVVLANLGGVALGPLISGIVAESTQDPLHVTFIIFAGLAVMAVLGLGTVPETVRRKRAQEPYGTQRIRIPNEHRRAFGWACVWGFFSFSVLSLSSSLVPGFLAHRLHDHSHLLAGVVVSAVVALAAVGQTALYRLGPADHVRLGVLAETTGMAVATVGLTSGLTGLFIAGLVLAGGGSGAIFRGCLTRVRALAPPAHRAETLAGLYVACYLGAISVVPLGALVDLNGAPLAMAILTAVLASAFAVGWRSGGLGSG